MRLICSRLITLCAVILLAGTGVTASAQDGRIRTDVLDPLVSKATDSVNINIDERMMQMGAKFLSDDDPEELKIRDIVKGLKGVYVRSLEFNEAGQYSPSDVEAIRAQLRAPLWTKMMGLENKTDGGLELYLMMNGNQVSGLTLLATEPKEITVINILGPIDLDKLSELEGHLGIPNLGLGRSKPKVKSRRNRNE